ncbi:fluoride efflux transporter CrcB [Paenibacillus spiritus]|uniref:Fluoride-specific ion channel FluC n=1 Tax=Paenibacillus spiritus TaxID=2496557 RepID=A0A5J5GJ23_9BACL|nr:MULTISPECIES: fluoride efflux transporter CrcB [Paenibacillus]KAA9007708.1 fluoride efflux transporter CrcB [Paenibacillus spiritus]
MNLFGIGIGGVIGAACRYGLGGWIGRRFGNAFPWGTLFINILGSFILGVLAGAGDLIPRGWYLTAGTGFCGGFTTFSTFGYETVTLLENGRYGRAAAYALLSLAVGLLGAWLGLKTGRTL